MSEAPTSCRVCSTDLGGSLQCPACNAVHGEDNRCPSCRSLAGIRPEAGGYACMSCGKPRERKPGSVLFEVQTLSAGDKATLGRVQKAGLRTFGIVSIAFGVAAAAGAMMAIGGVFGIAVALAAGSVGVGVGALSMKAAQGGEDLVARSQERELFQLAGNRNGVLTVSDVVQGMGLSTKDAERALSRVADGSRVRAELTPDGRVEYVFQELRALAIQSGQPLKVRVEEEVVAAARARVQADDEAALLEAAEAEVEASLRGESEV